jgi:hypothetical protein
MKYYYKLISKQDVTRSFVVNRKAMEYFFKLNLLNHGDEGTIILTYNSSDHINTKILLHQDCRLLIQGRQFEVGQIAFFECHMNNTYSLTILKDIKQIDIVKKYLIKNYYLSNTKIETNAY